MNLLLTQGNALQIPLADESVHCVMTSPPYWGLRKYAGEMAQIWGGDPDCAHEWGDEIIAKANDSNRGAMEWTTGGNPAAKVLGTKPSQGMYCNKCGAWYGELGLEPTPELYVENMVAVFREVRRVLRADGTLWLNMGDSYNGSGGAGGDYNEGGLKEGQPRYPGRDVGSLKPKDLCGIPWRVAFALQADGWWLRSDIIWSKPNPMPESVTDRPTKAHEYLFLLTKSARYYYDQDAVREEHAEIDRRSIDERGNRILGRVEYFKGEYQRGVRMGQHLGGRNRRTVWDIDDDLWTEFQQFLEWKYDNSDQRDMWHIATAPYSGAHFATYPPALVEPCIKAGTSERGVCPECGAPWRRVVEHKVIEGEYKTGAKAIGNYGGQGKKGSTLGSTLPHDQRSPIITTLGWQPTCSHYPHTERWQEFPSQGEMTDEEYYWSTLNIRLERRILVEFWRKFESVPATVFDPFAGSGTTLQVARALGRNGIGLDLSLEYLHLARQRLLLDALAAWGKAKKDGSAIDDLPMFELLRRGNDEENI